MSGNNNQDHHTVSGGSSPTSDNRDSDPPASSSQHLHFRNAGSSSPVPNTVPEQELSSLFRTQDREGLLSKARGFLQSPQIQYQDLLAKRRFLVEKGLNDLEIDHLLRELPPQAPSVPPRTYPQPPPSNLPNLLLGLARLFSWIGVGSAALLFVYYRCLLPRIIHTRQARHALRSHHLSLMRRLTASLASLKETQSESLFALPRSDPYREPPQFSSCSSVLQVLKTLEKEGLDFADIPAVPLLRCGIADFCKGKSGEDANPTTEELFRLLEGQIPRLISEEGAAFEAELWEALSTCPLFEGNSVSSTTSNPNVEPEKPTRWTYHSPQPSGSSPLVRSLDELASSLPVIGVRSSPFQHTLEALSGFTGYISTQVYLPHRSPSSGMGLAGNIGLSPAEEDLKKEIRALKGLVLNRRSFMPFIPRAGSLQRPTA